jgi:5-methylcytosine-specific restriction endonuclease McrA
MAACAICSASPNWSRHECSLSWQVKVVRKKQWTPYISGRGRRIFRPYEEFIDILWDSAGRYRVCTRKHRHRKDAERHAKQLTRSIQKGRGTVVLTDVVPPTLRRGRTPVIRVPVPGLNDAVWRLIREMYDGRCYYCGKGGKKLHREHRVPLARGGGNDISNIVPSCEPCNRRKGILTDDEFFKLLEDEFAYRTAADDGSDAEPPLRPFPGEVAVDGKAIRVPVDRGRRSKVELPPNMKRCPRCTRVLELDAFGKHKGKPDGLTSRCRECNAEATRLSRASRSARTEPDSQESP